MLPCTMLLVPPWGQGGWGNFCSPSPDGFGGLHTLPVWALAKDLVVVAQGSSLQALCHELVVDVPAKPGGPASIGKNVVEASL